MEDLLQLEAYDAPSNLSEVIPIPLKKSKKAAGRKPSGAGAEKRTRDPSAYNMFQKIEMGRMSDEYSGREKLSRVAGMWNQMPELEKNKMREFLKANMQILADKAPDPKQRFKMITELWIEMN
jgi:hypothetical protein